MLMIADSYLAGVFSQTRLFLGKSQSVGRRHCLSLAGQGGEELPRVLRATCWYERLGQAGALPAGS